MKPLLLVVTGPPASGKTTIARELASRHGLPLYAKDDLKELLFESIGTGDRAYSRRLGAAVFDLLFLIAQRELAVGRSLALEGNFVRGQAERQFSVLPSHHQLQVHCSAPEKVLIARYRSRERHPGHLDESITKEIVAAIRDGRHRPLDIGGELVEIDTSEPFDLDAVEKRLGGSY